MKSRLLLWSITASLAGFLFGFDTIVIRALKKTFSVFGKSTDSGPACV